MKTFSQLIQLCKDACIDVSDVNFDGISDSETFIKEQINSTVKHIFTLLRQYKLEPEPYTFTTVADTADYNIPIATLGVNTVTVLVANIKYDLKPVYSQAEYDSLTRYPNPSPIPQRFFPDGGKIYLYPKPQGAYTATVSYNFYPTPLTFEDVTTGTATIATASGVSTVTLSQAVATSSFVGKYFAKASNGVPIGNFHLISTYTDTTHFILDRTFEESTGSGFEYIVGQSIQMPFSLFEWIPYRVASIYYLLRRKEYETAKKLMNMYFTGDMENNDRKGDIKGGILLDLVQLQTLGRDNMPIVETAGYGERSVLDGIWSITVPS